MMKKPACILFIIAFLFSSCEKLNLKRDNPFEGKTTLKLSRYIVEDYPAFGFNNNGDGKINNGETIDLIIYIINNGSSQENKVRVSISTSSSYITGLENNNAVQYYIPPYDYILAGMEGSADNGFRFKVSSTTPSGSVIPFNVSITDESKKNWIDSFTITVN